MSVRLITDSSAGVTEEQQQKLDIAVVPIWLHLSDERYRDGVELDVEDFYDRLEAGETVTTSSPSPGEFAEAYRQSAAAGHDSVLVVTPSAKLSASFNSALTALNEFDQIPVEIIDSQTAITSQRFVVAEAAARAREGSGLAAVRDRASQIAAAVDLAATIDTFVYLRRSGRVNLAESMIGETLRVQPLFRLKAGEISALAPSLSKKAALMRIAKRVARGSGDLHAIVFHGNAPDRAQFLRERLEQEFPSGKVDVTRFSPALGAHTGPGVVGVSWWNS